ncbi:MAG: hypothetical protein GY742_15615 [Hyphomicrobiales bacterium]|nr:hypothetical protein [Hyphomicrobiales bacterium]
MTRHRTGALKVKYQTMVDANKPKKVAITAIMRKLIIIAYALIRDDRKWSEFTAISTLFMGL